MTGLFSIIAILVFASGASAQQVVMTMHLTDGSTIQVNTDSVLLMHPSDQSSVEERWMRLSTTAPSSYYDEQLAPSQIDSLSFSRKDGFVFLDCTDKLRYAVSPLDVPGLYICADTVSFPRYHRDTTITQLPDLYPYAGHEIMTAWHGHTIYSGNHGSIVKRDLRAGALPDTIIQPSNYHDLEVNDAGDRIAFSTLVHPFWLGRLTELDLKTGALDTLTIDSAVSSVRYLPNSPDMIYYSFGTDLAAEDEPHEKAGYYLFDRAADSSTLILAHYENNYFEELVNGFDVSHDGKKLLIPSIDRSSKITLIEYDMETKTADTIDAFPDNENGANSLWVQYSNNDSLILYSQSFIVHAPSLLGDVSEVGILDRASGKKQILNIAALDKDKYSAPYPRWSPDNKAVCYGAAALIPESFLDSSGPYQIYIKKLGP